MKEAGKEQSIKSASVRATNKKKFLDLRPTHVIEHKSLGKRIAQQLGVHYSLEGNVRQAGERIRVSAQLIERGLEPDPLGRAV